MLNATKQASLTASLLHRATCSPPAVAGTLLAAKPVVALDASQGSPFCRKGEASAESFRSLRYPTGASAAPAPDLVAGTTAPPAVQSLPKCGQGRRLWLRVDAARRAALKRAASAQGQTCQAFLVSALDAFLGEAGCPAVPDARALMLVPTAPSPLPSPEGGPIRVKLACWVDEARRARVALAAARLGRTFQSLLEAALDKHLDHATPTPPAQALLPLDPMPPLASLSRLVARGRVTGAAAMLSA
jgi:hypothetical protein